MNPVRLLQKRLESCPPEDAGMVKVWLEIAQRRQERKKARYLRVLTGKGKYGGHVASCPETRYKAEVLAGMR